MKAVFVCDSCGLGYRDPVVAFQCEQFCKENRACSIEIARKAAYKP